MNERFTFYYCLFLDTVSILSVVGSVLLFIACFLGLFTGFCEGIDNALHRP